MALAIYFRDFRPLIVNSFSRKLWISPSVCLIQKWRKERNLPMNSNSCGVLTDGVDYSYLDGRPTPYTVGQVKRLQKQKELAESIIQLSKEIDFAVERHKLNQKAEENNRQQIINSKLKPKGEALNKK